MEVKVRIRRQRTDYRIGETNFENLSGIHWDYQAGGLGLVSRTPNVYAYVQCDLIIGEIAHSCQHGSGPHNIKVAVLKTDQSADAWNTILEITGPNPHDYREQRKSSFTKDRARKYVEGLIDALKTGAPHEAVALRRNGIRKIILSRAEPLREVAKQTEAGRRRRIKQILDDLMPDWREGTR